MFNSPGRGQKMLLDHQDRQALLRIARRAIDNCLRQENPSSIAAPDSPTLQQRAGCFVTIKMGGELRGCIGTFTSDNPLHREIQRMAVAAATGDPRFYAMDAGDIGLYHLEISVLSPLEKITDIGDIEVGQHGIYLEKEYCRGVLLPQVATEYGWDRLTFLRQTAIKAGLPPDDWQSPQTDIYIFSAQIFADEDCA